MGVNPQIQKKKTILFVTPNAQLGVGVRSSTTANREHTQVSEYTHDSLILDKLYSS